MEWTQKSIIEFIELYKKIILDPKYPLCFNKIKMQDKWEELGTEMNGSVKKMENLLSSLRQEKMKMRKSSGTGKGEYF
jgi:hypothetical protein